MTITGGSGISKDEIDRMIKEAEAHAAEDAKRRQEQEARNSAEQLVYSTEQLLTDNADKLPEDVASEVRGKVDALKTALEGTDADTIATAQSELVTAAQKIGEALYAQQPADAAAGGNPGSDAPTEGAQAADDDVVDAEIVDEEDEKK